MRILTNNARLHLFTGQAKFCAVPSCLIKRRSDRARAALCSCVWRRRSAVAKRRPFCRALLFSNGDHRGGVILEPNPKWKKRFQPDVIEELKKKESGSSADVIELHIRQHDKTMVTVDGTGQDHCACTGGSGGRCKRAAGGRTDSCVPYEERYLRMAQKFAGEHDRVHFKRAGRIP